MIDKLIRAYARFVTRRPGLIIAVAAVLAFFAVRIASDLHTKPSRMDMVPADEPAVVAWRDFTADFHGLSTILMIVEGPADKSRAFVEEAAVALKSSPDFIRSVTHKADIARLEAQGLYLLDHGKLEDIEKGLIDLTPFVREISATPTGTRLFNYLAEEIGDEEAPPQETSKAIKGMEFVQDAVHALRASLETPTPKPPLVFPSLTPRAKKGKDLGRDDQGYIVSKSGTRLLVVITPAMDLREAKNTSDLLDAVEPKLKPIREKYSTVKATFAGGAIRSLEEETTVKNDMHKTAIVAGLAVILLCRMFFQGILPGLLLDVGLWLSILFNGALTKIFIGHINLIGAVFIPLLLGLGEDFGNYLMLTYQDSGQDEGPQTMEDAMVLSFRGCFLGALTTAAVFYSLIFHDFMAYREMGFICGNGIMLAWLANYCLLPALMMMRMRFPWLINKAKGQDYDQRFSGLGRGLVWLTRPRRALLAIAIVLIVVCIDSKSKIRFDYNLSNMASAGAETVAYEKILREEFGLSAEFAVVSAVDLNDVYAIHDALDNQDVVASVDGLATFIPRDTESKKDIITRIAEWGASRPRSAATVPPEAQADCLAALNALKEALKRPRRLANMGESPELHKALDDAEAELAATKKLLEQATPAAATAAFTLMHRAVRHDLDYFTNFLGSHTGITPYTFKTLPDEYKQRYVSPTGRLITFVSPAGELTTQADARTFYQRMMELEKLPTKTKITPKDKDTPGPKKAIEVAGVPLIIYRMMELVRSGFTHAAMVALATCFLMVLVDTWSLWLALLAMLPVLMGATWMTGAMAHWGLPWNPLDSIAIPILPGCGIAFGVNLIHRQLLERDMRVTMASTGRAALYSSFTTCVGFSVLLLANHRGLQSFAKVMVVGDAACCAACLTILPILLSYLVPDRPAADTHQ